MKQIPNIHIDRIRIKAPCSHKPTGKVMYFEEESIGAFVPSGATANLKGLKDGGKKAYVRSKEIDPSTGLATFIEIHCCPPLLLQKHNLFGHAVLQDYVYAILDLLTRRFEIEVDPFDRDQWENGCVSITEIHLTGNFRCPSDAILPIIQAIDDNNTCGKQRKIPSCITLGFSKTRRSTYHALTIYDKSLELMTHWKKPGPYQSKLIEEARAGIRAEVKLYSQELKLLGLEYVMRWQGVDVADLFFKFLNRYQLRYTIQRLLTADELAALTRTERKAYSLWLTGMSIHDQYARTSAWKITREIQKKTDINIKGNRRPDQLPAIDIAKVFSPENLLPIPEWAIGMPYYFAPSRKEESIFDRALHIALALGPIPDDELIFAYGEWRVI